jgi:hypothetical protein
VKGLPSSSKKKLGKKDDKGQMKFRLMGIGISIIVGREALIEDETI